MMLYKLLKAKNNLYRPFRQLLITTHCYCENKTNYQRNEESKKPRMIHGALYPEWRKPWIERDGEWRSKLSVFVEKNPSADILNIMQRIPDLSFKIIKEWMGDMKILHQVKNQIYISERVEILGSNLAAIHFFTFRGASVRLRGSRDWLSGDPSTLNLPDRFKEGYFVEAVDCSNFKNGGLRYEGTPNLADLNFLKWLSLKNNEYIDVWCLDMIVGQNAQSLEYLDISGCKICAGCIHALARLTSLKLLVVTDPGDNTEVQVGLSLLEEDNPYLLIKLVEEDLVETTQKQ